MVKEIVKNRGPRGRSDVATGAEGRGVGRRETGGARAWSRSWLPLQQPAFADGGRRARLRDLGRQSEVREKLPDDGRVLDGRDELHSATAPRARTSISNARRIRSAHAQSSTVGLVRRVGLADAR